MGNWSLLIVDGSAHLVDLDSKVIEIAGFGRFPGDILKEHDFDTEFEIFGNLKYFLRDLKILGNSRFLIFGNFEIFPKIKIPKP